MKQTKTYTVVEQVDTVPLGAVMALHDVLIQLKPEQRLHAIKAAMLFVNTPA